MSSTPSPNSNPSSNNQWRFTWETLTHVPTLRLYLFKPDTNPSARCRDVKASLQPSQRSLLVTWTEGDGGGDSSVRVPVPRVLIDPVGSVDVNARDDHIEVKLVLVLPVDHPIVLDLRGVLGSGEVRDRLAPLSLGSELKNLSSGGVHFVCKTCSTRLTRQPLRCFVELPSVNWREAADNWFGACCCSFGGISEKLVSKYVRSYACIEGTCLLDTASVIVCKDDLEGSPFPHCCDAQSCYKTDLELNGNPFDANEESSRSVIADISHFSPTSSCAPHSVRTSTKCDEHTNSMAQLSLNEPHSAISLDSSKSNPCSANFEKPFSDPADGLWEDNCHCCIDEADYLMPAKDQQPHVGPEKVQKGLDDCYLGSGFMSRTLNLSDDVEWVQFLCRHCSSTLGSYPSSKTANGPLDNGVRLFKCYISTDFPAGGSHDLFRKYTLERIFVSLLLEGAKDELSFRIVLRDLKTKSPMLQIVLLNTESWCSSGNCMENGSIEPLPEIDLQPVVKLLFSDCTSAKGDSSRIKDWLTRTHTEEAYMMAFQIEELTDYLKSAVNRLPTSCSYLQGMSISYMER
ncbi:uncharacterized protein M6B38_286875 [Iris pallida]|uniref:Ubiquitin-conjugating enzyme E2C-binding protein n=1 Tax=Iris pallida TaxID=29817 RepID=A0AAX6HY55_IRIPA|nr:uncharacterized protein M6B38_286875 [Iris pallida]